MNRMFPILTFATGLLLAGCGGGLPSPDPALAGADNRITNSDRNLTRTIGDSQHRFQVQGSLAFANSRTPLSSGAARAFLDGVAAGGAQLPTTATGNGASGDNSLVLGFPVGLLGQGLVFGGVITKVSDTTTQAMGDLKLTDIPPVHVTSQVVSTGNDEYAFVLVGCANSCQEGSDEKVLLAVPVVGVDTNQNLVQIDLASLGKQLNLMQMLDPDGSQLGMATVSSTVVGFDYSVSTLVFDVDVKMKAAGTKGATPPPGVASGGTIDFTVRWYLRLSSVFSPSFTPRPAANGVGFFLTDRAASPVIERQPEPVAVDSGLGQTLVPYYIKGVPTEYRAAFAASFDAWNDEFTKLLGKKMVSYEFVETTDPRFARLVTGDARFHILEWDTVNQASYGGLGPAIASQYTGEIFSSNILIQGPTIVALYSKWFGVAQKAQELKLAGRADEAEAMLRQAALDLEQLRAQVRMPRLKLDLGSQLSFRVTAQMPSYRDPLFERDDFEAPPAGLTYDDYMTGYFRDMVTHELGHNMGLRHNFRGSLAAANPIGPGKVSDSVMEYLGREFRYLDGIGDYDRMAIAYGYTGQRPAKTNLYCTDEDAGSSDQPENSAECSPDDATGDPFSYLLSQLDKAIAKLTSGTDPGTPVWAVPDMDNELKVALVGMALYATSAEKYGKTWTNFFTGLDRPATVEGVRSYVVAQLRSRLCGPGLDQALAAKATSDARQKTSENIAALRKKASDLLMPLKFTAAELNCP